MPPCVGGFLPGCPGLCVGADDFHRPGQVCGRLPVKRPADISGQFVGRAFTPAGDLLAAAAFRGNGLAYSANRPVIATCIGGRNRPPYNARFTGRRRKTVIQPHPRGTMQASSPTKAAMHALPTRRGKGAAGAHFHTNFVHTLAYRHKHFDNAPKISIPRPSPAPELLIPHSSFSRSSFQSFPIRSKTEVLP